MPCPAYQIHRGDHRTQEYSGLKGYGVVYGVAYLEKKNPLTRDYLPPDGSGL